MNNLLDDHLIRYCKHPHCPSDTELRKFPMLHEDRFDEIDERLYRCEECKKRMKYSFST